MRVLITDYDHPNLDIERGLFTIAGVEMVEAQCRSAQQVIEAGRDADAFITSYAPVTAAVFEALPALGMISALGIGVDHIDTEAARRHGVWVSNVPDGNINEVATHALAMALSLIRHLPFYDRAVREGLWLYDGPGPMRRPARLTLGVVGLGRIGQSFVRLALPCFAQVLGHDPYLPATSWPESVARAKLDDLLAASDVVSLHMPLTRENANLVDAAALAKMKRGSYLVNVSRGGLVDLAALAEALDGGHLAGAALDVMPTEPPAPDEPILRHRRVLMTPHAAFYSTEAEEELRRKSVLNVLGWLRDGVPPNAVIEGERRPPV